MINRYFQVARTYYTRPRFWFWGGLYALGLLWRFLYTSEPLVHALCSLSLAMALGCFIALHLRRQFSGSAASLWPDFARLHLAVGAAASLLVWVVVPSIEAWLSGLSAVGLIALHAIAGIFLALVVCFRQVILSLVALPLVALAIVPTAAARNRFTEVFDSLIAGGAPWSAVLLIGAATGAHLIAAWVLIRLGHRPAPLSDDLLAEAPGAELVVAGHLSGLLLAFRDRAIGHRLADAGHLGWSVTRWRLPVAVSVAHFAIVAGTILTVMGVVSYLADNRGGAASVAVLTVPLLLVAPFSLWHQRHTAMSSEFMRPVTRGQYFRQMALALAMDVACWTALALALATFTLSLFIFPNTGNRWELYQPLLVQAEIMIAISIWLYGFGVMSFGLRYWIPILIGLMFVWVFVTVPIVERVSVAWDRNATFIFPNLFAGVTASAGVLMTMLAHRHWVNSDVT